jgi:hypothetical protein
MTRRSQAGGIRLPSDEEPIAPVTILDSQGRVVRVVPASEFRRARGEKEGPRPLLRWSKPGPYIAQWRRSGPAH